MKIIGEIIGWSLVTIAALAVVVIFMGGAR